MISTGFLEENINACVPLVEQRNGLVVPGLKNNNYAAKNVPQRTGHHQKLEKK
jgi:hypothetical protein